MSALPAPIDIINNSAAQKQSSMPNKRGIFEIYSVCNEDY